MRDGGLVIVATPMAALREQLAALPADARVLWLCKGFEAGTGALGHEIAASVRPRAWVRRAVGPELRAGSGARGSRPRWSPRAPTPR